MSRDRERVVNDEPRPDTEALEAGGRAVLRTRIFHMDGVRVPGYYVEVCPVTLTAEGTCMFVLTAGVHALLEPAARFSAKRLASLVAPPEVVARLRDSVLSKGVRS